MLVDWIHDVCVTRTRGSSRGGRRPSGGAGQTSVTTPPSARGVGSRRKEASAAPLRSSSGRSEMSPGHHPVQFCGLRSDYWLSIYNHLLCCPRRGGDDKKDKGGDKTPEHQASGEHEASGKNPKLGHMELNRGTAVWTQQQHNTKLDTDSVAVRTHHCSDQTEPNANVQSGSIVVWRCLKVFSDSVRLQFQWVDTFLWPSLDHRIKSNVKTSR